jgi:hypothetical protein
LQDSLLRNFDRWHETAVVRFLATSSAALVRNQACNAWRAVMVLPAVLGFFDSVTFQALRSARSEESAVPGSVKERRFLAMLGMTSSERFQIIFVSEIAMVLEIGWDDQAF